MKRDLWGYNFNFLLIFVHFTFWTQEKGRKKLFSTFIDCIDADPSVLMVLWLLVQACCHFLEFCYSCPWPCKHWANQPHILYRQQNRALLYHTLECDCGFWTSDENVAIWNITSPSTLSKSDALVFALMWKTENWSVYTCYVNNWPDFGV